ncbi:MULTISPECIES: glycosyl transferase [unclassified Microbacterium]|uniref:glycosyl transferase n=1 Tax=unclassified Microbacterium TaxID=2609290 RepID=UPI000EAA02F4|nr:MULTISPECIES: glycosyl transferase [unclassified Microbacterium]MBT2485752.1 glycosyl transferase [Microbacterium sp. ISL-108]RKN68517.1 glycosyl transferase [Microbacterium sp. CGR2]
MRFVWAVVAFVLAAGLIGAGIAQRTIFLGPESQQTRVDIEEPAPFVLLDGEVLQTNPGAQTLLIRGEGEIYASYGRTPDMEAWLADSEYNHVTADGDDSFDVEHVPAADAADGGEGDAEAEAPAGRNPAGSDLWLDSFSEENLLISDNMQLPEGTSVLIAYDGTQDAPDDIVVSWPLDQSTPWAGPLMAAGGLMLLLGLILYFLGIRHQRRGRGPRRKGPGPLPVTEPIDVAALPPSEREALEASGSTSPKSDARDAEIQEGEIVDEGAEPGSNEPDAKTQMQAERPARRRRLLAIPALALTAVLAAGCSSESWPQLGASSPTPSPSPTVIAPDNQKPPAVTEAQATRILQSISATLVDADAALDLDLAKTRLDGSALAARTTDYALRAKIKDATPPSAIPTDDVEVVLPEATDRWPRTVLMLSKSTDDDTVPPVILTMTQQDPWSNYKVTNMAEMSADAVFPEVAAAWLGTSLVPSDSAFLRVPPADLAAAFADVVDTGEKSASYELFDELSLNLAASINESRQAVVQNLADNNAAKTSKAAFDMAPTTADPVSMTTLDSGAIVAVSLTDAETVTPTSADAVIRFGDNAQAKALTGASESAKGVETTYEFQLFFAVPAQGSTEQIKLLAVRQDLLSVKVIK